MQKFVETDQNVLDEVERAKWKNTLLTLAKDWRLYVLLIPMLAFIILFRIYLPGKRYQKTKKKFSEKKQTKITIDFFKFYFNTIILYIY